MMQLLDQVTKMFKSHQLSQPWGDTLFYYCLVPHFVNWHVFLNSAHAITLGLETKMSKNV